MINNASVDLQSRRSSNRICEYILQNLNFFIDRVCIVKIVAISV